MQRAALLLLVLSACAAPPPAAGVFPVGDETAERRPLRYRDGQVSANDSCMIRLGNRLNPGVPPLYVNGAPLGFC